MDLPSIGKTEKRFADGFQLGITVLKDQLMATNETISHLDIFKSDLELGHAKSEGEGKQPAPFNLYSGNRISYRLYSDTRPHCLEIAPLQKGLVLTFSGKELIEEGVGFGVPVVKYADKTYFSSSAESFMSFDKRNRPVLIKCFNFDAISRKRVGRASYINDKFYSRIHRLFEKAYLGNRKLIPIFNTVMEMRRTLRIQTDFIKVKSRGKVTVRYTCLPEKVGISADFSELERTGRREILVLNEQGSSFFRAFLASDGTNLHDRNIGAWERVMADTATFSDKSRVLSFTLKKVKGAMLYRGWESTKGRFAWAGLSYSLLSPLSTFRYIVRLTRSIRDQKQP